MEQSVDPMQPREACLHRDIDPARMIRPRFADSIRASSPSGLHQQAGHMTASDLCAARPKISCQAGKLLGGAAAAWPLAARAQQAGKLPTIGFLGAATPSAWGPYTAAFAAGIRELGWIEGRTIAIEYRWAEGRPDRYAEIAAEFVRRKVDVIVTSGTAAGAVKLATSTIPIVFAVAVEPISSGLVANLARPGGNLTGLSSQTGDLGGKRLDLLREVVPGLRRLAIMGYAGYSASTLEMGEVAAAARALGFEVVILEVRRAEDFAPAF